MYLSCMLDVCKSLRCTFDQTAEELPLLSRCNFAIFGTRATICVNFSSQCCARHGALGYHVDKVTVNQIYYRPLCNLWTQRKKIEMYSFIYQLRTKRTWIFSNSKIKTLKPRCLLFQVSVIVKAQRLLCLTHHSRPAFSDNVISAYKLLRDKGRYTRHC